jgi:hypothetical protein
MITKKSQQKIARATARHKERLATDPEYKAKKVEYMKKYHLEHKEQAKAKKVKYHTTEGYAAYLKNQRESRKLERERLAGRPLPLNCEVCNETGDIHYDHDHATGKFRGWLCQKCNNTLGLARDNPAILHALAQYLVKHYLKEELKKLINI